jgi:hypothetical protein
MQLFNNFASSNIIEGKITFYYENQEDEYVGNYTSFSDDDIDTIFERDELTINLLQNI